jgi:hypothetical protein
MIGSGFDRFFWNPQEGAFRDDRNHPWFNRVLRNFSYRASNYSIKIRIAMYYSTRELGRACNRSSTVLAVRPTTIIRSEESPRRVPHRIRKTDGPVNLIEIE